MSEALLRKANIGLQAERPWRWVAIGQMQPSKQSEKLYELVRPDEERVQDYP